MHHFRTMPEAVKRRLGRRLHRHYGKLSRDDLLGALAGDAPGAGDMGLEASAEAATEAEVPLARIIAVMKALDPEFEPGAFTATGLPSVDALSARLGRPVSARERNEAWRALQARREPEPTTD